MFAKTDHHFLFLANGIMNSHFPILTKYNVLSNKILTEKTFYN